MMMKRLFLAAALLCSLTGTSQIVVSGDAFLKGNYVEIGIEGAGGFEGAGYNAMTPPLSGMHFRSGNPRFGFVANPQMDGWAQFNGDFYSPGTPENGWGITIAGTSFGNNCYPLGQIPGSVTSWSHTSGVTHVIWQGSIMSLFYNLGITLDYELGDNDLYYTTHVTITNNGAAPLDSVYYYRTIDPDNNQAAPGGSAGPGAGYSTYNTVTDEPLGFSTVARVQAEQYLPWYSLMAFEGFGPNFRVTRGGFSNRDGYKIWHAIATAPYTGVMAVTDSIDVTRLHDAAISLAYLIPSLNVTESMSFKFYTLFADDIVLDELTYAIDINYNSSDSVITSAVADTIYKCGELTMNVEGTDVPLYNWSWSPAAGLDTTGGYLVHCTTADTMVYTLTGISLDSADTLVKHITVIPSDLFSLSSTHTDDHCFLSTGTASSAVSGLPGYSYTCLWSNGDAALMADSLFAGKYTISVTNQYGCVQVDTVQVGNIEPVFTLSAMVDFATCAACPDGEIDLTAGVSPVSVLSFQWNSGPATEDLSGILPGIYIVTVTDAYGCTAADTFEVGYLSGIEGEHLVQSLGIYPVPAGEYLVVSAGETLHRIDVYTAEGRLLESVHTLGERTQVIPTHQWPKGLYCLRVFAGNGAAVRTIIKE